MNPGQLPETRYELYGLIVIATLSFLTQLLQFAKIWIDAHQIKQQNAKQLDGQAEIKVALDGVTAARVEAGHTQGMADQREIDHDRTT